MTTPHIYVLTELVDTDVECDTCDNMAEWQVIHIFEGTVINTSPVCCEHACYPFEKHAGLVS